MIGVLEVACSWALPLLAGMGIWQVLTGFARGGAGFANALGYGYIIGVLLVGEMVPLFAAADTHHALTHLAPWLVAIAAVTWALAWIRRFKISAAVALPSVRLERGWPGMCLVLLLLFLLRLWVLTDEVLLRPIFPWDAWAAWAVKPKTWFEAGHAVAFVSVSDWLAQPLMELRTASIWNYPNLLGWIEVWFASGAGEWNEPLINLAWVGLWLALLAASYGQWRLLGLSRSRAVVATYALGSLPLMNAHVALAGYADIWLAAVFGLSVLAWLNWLKSRALGQLIIAISLALTLPAIKLEGAVWLLCFSIVLVLSFTPPRLRLVLSGAALLLVTIGIALGGFILPVFGLGLVKVAWGAVDIPTLGVLALHWRSVGQAMIASLYTLPNWHLLWFLVPLVLLLRWREFRYSESLRLLGGLLLLCAVFLFVLFFFTEAARWAEDYTSANRLVMQITPAVMTLLVLLLRDFNLGEAARDTAP